MKENPLIEKIDSVLFLIAEKENGITSQDLSTHFSDNKELSKSELALIMQKLIKDGYVVPEHISTDSINLFAGYKITFEGKVFAYQLGYASIEWTKKRDWEFTKMAQEFNKNQIELQRIQTDTMQIQSKLMEEQTALQKGVRTLTVFITIGTIVAAIYYAIEIYQLLHNCKSH